MKQKRHKQQDREANLLKKHRTKINLNTGFRKHKNDFMNNCGSKFRKHESETRLGIKTIEDTMLIIHYKNIP